MRQNEENKKKFNEFLQRELGKKNNLEQEVTKLEKRT